MLLGKTISPPLPWPPAENDDGPKELFKLALGWLKEDKVTRKEREKVTGRIRGPKAEVSSSSPLLSCITVSGEWLDSRHTPRILRLRWSLPCLLDSTHQAIGLTTDNRRKDLL